MNKKIIGLMKDENNGKIMKEFVGLRSKMYSIDVINGKKISKAKGVKRSVVNKFNILDYKNCLFNKSIIYRDMTVFRSKLHNIYTQNLNKVALSSLDNKRFVLDDNINTYAWGHYKIPEILLEYLEQNNFNI